MPKLTQTQRRQIERDIRNLTEDALEIASRVKALEVRLAKDDLERAAGRSALQEEQPQ